MPDRAVHLVVVDGFADWEPAHAIAELRRNGSYRVETVGLSMDPVESMGGMRVQPSKRVSDVRPRDVATMILPGGDRWESLPIEPALGAMLGECDAAGVPIAAICAGTVAVARLGLLRGRRHTSNGFDYLRGLVPEYVDGASYVDAAAVRDRGLITANGLSDIEFARELMEELDVMTPDDRRLWSTMFRSGRLPGATV
jgi:putative intracellular protease/amidase